MFSFINAHTPAQTALYSEYDEMFNDTSVMEVAGDIFTLIPPSFLIKRY